MVVGTQPKENECDDGPFGSLICYASSNPCWVVLIYVRLYNSLRYEFLCVSGTMMGRDCGLPKTQSGDIFLECKDVYCWLICHRRCF